jgi:hypothetical protein
MDPLYAGPDIVVPLESAVDRQNVSMMLTAYLTNFAMYLADNALKNTITQNLSQSTHPTCQHLTDLATVMSDRLCALRAFVTQTEFVVTPTERHAP